MSEGWSSDWRHKALCAKSGIPAAVWTADRRPRVAVRRQMEAVCRLCTVRTECAANALVSGMESAMVSGVWVPLDISANERRSAEVRRQLTVIARDALEAFGRAYVDSDAREESAVIDLIRARAGGGEGDQPLQWGPGDGERLGAAV